MEQKISITHEVRNNINKNYINSLPNEYINKIFIADDVNIKINET